MYSHNQAKELNFDYSTPSRHLLRDEKLEIRSPQLTSNNGPGTTAASRQKLNMFI